MKQLSPTSLYAVELPEVAKDVKINSYNEMFYQRPGTYPAWKELPDGNWQFHFTTATATEQDWAGVVEKETDEIMIEIFGDLFMNYETEVKILCTATESGHSLLAANGLEVGRNYAILTIKQ